MSSLPVDELALAPALEPMPTLFCCELLVEVLSNEGSSQTKKIAMTRRSVKVMATMRESFFFCIDCTGVMDVSICGSSEFMGVGGAVMLTCGRVCCCESWYSDWACDAARPGLRNCVFGSIVQSPPT